MGKRGAWTVGGLLLTLAACTSDPQPGPASAGISAAPSPALAADVGCPDSIDQSAVLPTEYRLVAGVVGVPTERVLGASAPGERDDPAAKFFAKWGLVVRAGQTVEIAVGTGWERKAEVGWGNPGRPASRVRVQACPATGGAGAWTAFAGGTWVQAPACVPLTIRADGRVAQIRLPIGTACR